MSPRSRIPDIVQAALDARREPLSDPALLAALEAEPEAYADIERLIDRIEALASAPAPATRTAPAVRPFAHWASLAAGAMLAIGFGLLAVSMPTRIPTARSTSVAEPLAGSAGEILEFHVSIARTSPTEQRFVFNDNGYVTHEHSYTGYDRTAVAPAAPRVTIRHRQVVANRR